LDNNQSKNKSAQQYKAFEKIVIDEKKSVLKIQKQKKGSQNVGSSKKYKTKKKRDEPKLRIIPLGGIGEIGKNITAYECGDDIIIVDCGMGFPDDELLGIDIVIPDFTYLEENKEKVRAVLITHAHEDHIGALPYFLKQVNVPVYGAALTIGLIKAKLTEHRMLETASLYTFKTGDKIKLGCFTVEPIRVNHSIPDAVSFAITSPAGVVVQTGDFKVDYTPVSGEPIDLVRFAELGREGVLALLSDSTNSEKMGTTPSEKMVGQSFEMLFSRAEGKRLVIATFASNIHRIQQIIDLARRHGRKVAISGRSMENYVQTATELGYLDIDDDILIETSQINKVRPRDLIIVTTGSQGEPMSALSRMASGTHRQISITRDDVIIISASPIPGNEKTITRVINELLKKGSDVIYESMYDVHASGHACQNDQKLMLTLVKPRYFIPVHGEYKHLIKHIDTAKSMGYTDNSVIIPEIGKIIELSKGSVRSAGTVTAGRVLVDGLGVGDVGSVVLRDRQHLAQDGLIVVVCTIDTDCGELISGPDLISRGFVYVREAESLIEEARSAVKEIIESYECKGNRDWSAMKMQIREELGKLMYQKTKRNPMILPIVMEI